jgi:molybdenum cofactor synthesis domain-containing protein
LGEIVAVCVSEKKGTRKEDRRRAELRPRHGLVGDAHAGDWHRQVSLLAEESIAKARAKGLEVKPGDFGENLTTRGLDLPHLPIGTRLVVSAAKPVPEAEAGREAGPKGGAAPCEQTGPEAREQGPMESIRQSISQVVVEVTQIGKVCHDRCAIYYLAGDCIMPREGIFARVICSGEVRTGDRIEVDDRARMAILTASDKGSRGEREDKSSEAIRSLVKDLGVVCDYAIVPDERETISSELRRLSDERGVDLVITTGGTGLSPTDITPEATLDIIDRQVPGLAEAMRIEGLRHTSRAMLSRAVAGIRGRTLIVNLPGSPKGVTENLSAILPVLPHALEILRGAGGECGENIGPMVGIGPTNR